MTVFAGVMGFGDASVAAGSKGTKTMLKHLSVLKDFLEIACPVDAEDVPPLGLIGGLHWSAGMQLRRAGAGEFRYLGLFEVGDSEGPEDAEGRRWWCREKGQGVMGRLRKGLDGLAKEGGEVGRAAWKVAAVLEGVLEVREE